MKFILTSALLLLAVAIYGSQVTAITDTVADALDKNNTSTAKPTTTASAPTSTSNSSITTASAPTSTSNSSITTANHTATTQNVTLTTANTTTPHTNTSTTAAKSTSTVKPTAAPSNGKKKVASYWVAVGTVLGAVFGVIVTVVICLACRKCRSRGYDRFDDTPTVRT